jgi:hypothetical protein
VHHLLGNTSENKSRTGNFRAEQFDQFGSCPRVDDHPDFMSKLAQKRKAVYGWHP